MYNAEFTQTCHAPRERVSWNEKSAKTESDMTESRSTWACELKLCIYPVSNNFTYWSRSTWACELKLLSGFGIIRKKPSRSTWACELKWNFVSSAFHKKSGHAPRERVSWNIYKIEKHFIRCQSRSTWACELKSAIIPWQCLTSRHAPRERVSWNATLVTLDNEVIGHAPRERVSWNHKRNVSPLTFWMSRSTWACELKWL